MLIVSRARPLAAEVRLIRRFDDSFTELWDALAPKFGLAVRRDASYLNWKFATAPHVRYTMAALLRDGRTAGYVVYRHVQEPRGRVTLLTDILTDPDDEDGFSTLLRWIDQEARQADSERSARSPPRGLSPSASAIGLFPGEVDDGVRGEGERHRVGPEFYEDTDRWHVTLGDSDQDR